jgi:hypothetical protein
MGQEQENVKTKQKKKEKPRKFFLIGLYCDSTK